MINYSGPNDLIRVVVDLDYRTVKNIKQQANRLQTNDLKLHKQCKAKKKAYPNTNRLLSSRIILAITLPQDPLRAFFRELSAAYEACRLGRHRPLQRVGRDGILRAPPSSGNNGDDEWTGPLPSGRASAYIRG